MAFSLFQRAAADVVVLEVGLGGRLDATNVIDPLISVVTNIGLEHTSYLGPTREAIALEKAGVFKRGRPAVVGERDPAICEVLLRAAGDAGAEPVFVVAGDTRVRLEQQDATGVRFALDTPGTSMTCRLGLPGAHQMWNAAVALRALAELPANFATTHAQACPSLPRVRLAGRFEVRHDTVFDVAHNPDGAAVCADTLRAIAAPRPRTALFCVLADKDWQRMLEVLAPEIDHFVFTVAPTSPAGREWDPAGAAETANRRGWSASVVPDFDEALSNARQRGKTVLITGSFHTVGDAMARLHVSPLAG
jgi:dihydrofolate synthase/folylpolyglutamate synthase